jgi:hypothetical protein
MDVGMGAGPNSNGVNSAFCGDDILDQESVRGWEWYKTEADTRDRDALAISITNRGSVPQVKD